MTDDKNTPEDKEDVPSDAPADAPSDAPPKAAPKAPPKTQKKKGPAPATNLPSVQKRLGAEKKQQEEREEEAAQKSGTPEGLILVRLIRPMTRQDGEYLPAGLHHLHEDEIPSSAKRID